MFNFKFRRFDKSSEVEGFGYKSTHKPQEIDNSAQAISMDRTGFNIHFNIRNFTAEDVLIGGNLRAVPTRAKSLRVDGARPQDDLNNFVIITIYSTENTNNPDPKLRCRHTSKTEIRIPGKMLNQGSVFVSELDCYIMKESQLEATRELIARDVSSGRSESINIPSTMTTQDPAKLYIESKELVKDCIERQDKISIRVGVDLKYGEIPDIIKTMRVSIVDSYFVPYTSYKLLYDPTLNADEFIIENLYLASTQVYKGTFSQLKRQGYEYLSYDEFDTLFGRYYGMAIFANEANYHEYVYNRKTQERFENESLYVAERSGDPRLKEELGRVNRELSATKDKVANQEGQLTELKNETTQLRATIRTRDDTINKIRQRHESKMGPDVVLAEMENDSKRIDVDAQKIENERKDQEHREKTAEINQKASTLKLIADMMKSGWGITTACLGGVLAIAALLKKYNVKVSMST